LFPVGASATPIPVSYVGDAGLSAQATFDLMDDGSTLQIVLCNMSIAPFGGDEANGSANMVLSSINFDLGDVDIVGGTVALGSLSNVVTRLGTLWNPQPAPDLDVEYGYSNTGIGNAPAPFPNALHSVTSHSNGGNAVTNFAGEVGGVGGGLDFGLVAAGSSPFGNNEFILDCVDIRLNLSAPLADLGFLENGSYVEFGSDYRYVPVPEPAAAALCGVLALAWAAAAAPCRRRVKK
jgi:hypothetical protein